MPGKVYFSRPLRVHKYRCSREASALFNFEYRVYETEKKFDAV